MNRGFIVVSLPEVWPCCWTYGLVAEPVSLAHGTCLARAYWSKVTALPNPQPVTGMLRTIFTYDGACDRLGGILSLVYTTLAFLCIIRAAVSLLYIWSFYMCI